ncbi:MAG: zinc ribbon domain-containing protein [Lachnospiraceae bacterium]|nr:zinc ribbon domain-containing protein [Lachnospiraceae bacterium]
MEFFDKLGETLMTAGRDVSQKAKELSGAAKLNLDIKAKEDFVQKQYAEIGRQYYEAHKDDASTEFEQFASIREALESIEQMKKDLLELKGAKACPQCGAKMSEDAAFCSECGASLTPAEEPEVPDEEKYEE